ncbi:hypothetical protein EPA93_19995 [Ktedonosporobacter rubrisoli]|uniref:Uncharacterized protein n=1 Tax=Ktedonosporobacter rubrisoli TaxID=2509675 RepID=A0A4P6JS57_KTERU|nr:hypothetical protein [Ktedonosporobacter rubrisoli]QBD78155.1 hypothetical protein EPA93_19995 [Ktedonosporobacter rubrisoli]
MLAPDYRLKLVSLLSVLQRKRFNGRANAMLPLPFFLWPFAFFLKRRRKFAHIYLKDGHPYAYQLWQNGKLLKENAPVVRLLLRTSELNWLLQYPQTVAGPEHQYPWHHQYPYRLREATQEEMLGWPRRQRQVYCLADGTRSWAHIAHILQLPTQ